MPNPSVSTASSARWLSVALILISLLTASVQAQDAAAPAPAAGARGGRGGGRGGRGGATPAVALNPDGTPLVYGTPADQPAKPKPIPAGPYEPTWDSLAAHWVPPEWFRDAKFGIFIHWGLYSLAAHGNEWYVQHMYAGDAAWHTQNFGPLDKFGYKDFIPLFTVPKYDPQAWAELFKNAGAKYVMPVAEHHDGFAMWDSDLTPWSAGKMGPKRDLIGELAKAVRAEGLHFAVSSHRIEHYSFISKPNQPSDLDDPLYANFYWVYGRSQERYQAFVQDWIARQQELIDKYQPDLLYWDNGINGRDHDPEKLAVAAYYYNRAVEWGKQVGINTKQQAFLAGGIRDYERGRAPDLEPNIWQEDTAMGHNSWGYVTNLQLRNAGEMVHELIDCVSKNGNYLLNISPKGDGSIPADQQLRLLEIGEWLKLNGDAIYGTRPWIKYGEGSYTGTVNAQSERGITDAMLHEFTASDIRFTTKGDTLNAILLGWPADNVAVIKSLALGQGFDGQITRVNLIGYDGRGANLAFTQDAEGLKVTMPSPFIRPCEYAFVLKISGLKLPPAVAAVAAVVAP